MSSVNGNSKTSEGQNPEILRSTNVENIIVNSNAMFDTSTRPLYCDISMVASAPQPQGTHSNHSNQQDNIENIQHT